MAKTTVPGLYIADGAITAAKLSSTLDLSGVTITVATASSGDSDTSVASTAFVQQEIAALVDSSPSALNTLNELAAAIGDDASFSTTVTNSIATKLPLAGGTLTGNLIINTTGSIQIPVGTTAQRPTAAQGQLRFNTTTSKPEIYSGSAWTDVGGGVESVNSATGVVVLTTANIAENTNLYYTDARADARIAAADTDDLSEGSTNLYFTTARANSAFDGRLSGSTGVTVSNGAVSIGQDVATSTSPTFQNLTLSGTNSIKVPSGTTAQRSGSPANGMLRYNSSTNEFEGYADSAWGAIGGDTTSSVDLYTATGNGSTATYDTGKNPQSENNTWVFVGGVYQPKSTYSFSGTQITLSENLPNGEDLEVITGTVSTYNPTDAILGQYNVTTSNTASYNTSLTTENENNVFVFVDGVYQPKSSYTYSGSTLTLDAVPTSGMSLEVLVTRSMNAATVTTGFLADDAVTTVKILDANVTAGKLASSLDLTGKTVTVATASAGDNDTSVASTAFVRQEITSLVDSAPAAMDTLNELAAALGDDANFSTTVNASIAAKLPLAGGTLTGDLNFGDSNKAVFGAGNDLKIYHDGSNSYIQDSGTGNLTLLANGSRILMETAGGETLAEFINNGNVVLYSNNNERLRTNGTGIDVTGTVTAEGLTVDGTIKLDGNYPTGTDNVALGNTALDSLTSGVQNIAIGAYALTANTEGTGNVAIGRASLEANTTADSNTAIGKHALLVNTTGNTNVAIGSLALDANTTGNANVAIGGGALTSATTASYNTAVGQASLESNTTGTFNSALGRSSLVSNTTGEYNTALGYSSLAANTTASYNVAVGGLTLDANTTSRFNVAMGWGALGSFNNTSVTDGNNTAIGHGTLNNATTGVDNTYVGTNAGDNGLLTGSYNVSIGSMSSRYGTTANNNTAVGYAALQINSTGRQNTAIGSGTLDANTTGENNTAVGMHALTANTTADENTAVGGYALADNTTGTRNTAVGLFSLIANTTGSNNTGVGRSALQANTTGEDNTAVGRNSLDANTTGHSNTAIGEASLTTNTTGIRNTSIGKDSMVFNSTGSENVAIGREALIHNTTASNNTAIGKQTLSANTTGTRNTALSYPLSDDYAPCVFENGEKVDTPMFLNTQVKHAVFNNDKTRISFNISFQQGIEECIKIFEELQEYEFKTS